MKLKILMTLLCAISLSAFSQTGVKIYGFYRDVLPGTIPKGNEESGKPLSRPNESVEYMIYLSGPSKTRIYPVEMWINGDQFTALAGNVTMSPVQITNNLGKKETLIPKTSGKILKVNPTELIAGKKFPNAKSKAAINELVVVYKMNGKFYSAVLKKLVRLEPKSNE